jgi:ectoine hydroxylase-related dioxygenase (phytanoyl-CoA dioxygenase family)
MALDIAGLRRHYKTHGFVGTVPVLPREEAAALLGRLERLEAESAAAAGGVWEARTLRPWESPPHAQEDLLREVVTDDRVLAPVKALLGEDLLLRNCDVFIKNPGSVRAIDWHTDTGHIGRSTNGMLTLWLALTPATAENGAMQFVSGSHIYPEAPPPRDNQHLCLTEEEAARIDASRVATNTLAPGEASLHHFGLVHRSQANRSAARRVALVMRFMAPWVSRWASESGRAVLVSGRDRYAKYLLERRFPITWTVQ